MELTLGKIVLATYLKQPVADTSSVGLSDRTFLNSWGSPVRNILWCQKYWTMDYTFSNINLLWVSSNLLGSHSDCYLYESGSQVICLHWHSFVVKFYVRFANSYGRLHSSFLSLVDLTERLSCYVGGRFVSDADRIEAQAKRTKARRNR
jgi:hypothetical protein